MKDIAGQTIKIGSYVVYATSVGHFAEMTFGRIVKFTTIKPYHKTNSGAVLVTATLIGSPDYVGHARILVEGRTLVLPKSQVPRSIRKTLDAAYELKVADKRSVPRRSVRAGRA